MTEPVFTTERAEGTEKFFYDKKISVCSARSVVHFFIITAKGIFHENPA